MRSPDSCIHSLIRSLSRRWSAATGTWPNHPSADPRGPPSGGLVPCRRCEDAGRRPRTHFFVIKPNREDARLLAAIFIPLRTKAASSLLKLLTFSQSFLRPTHVLSGAPHPCFPDIFRILGGFPFSRRLSLSGSVMGASSTHSMFGGGQGLCREAVCGSELRVRGKEGLGWERGAQAWAVKIRLGVNRLSK